MTFSVPSPSRRPLLTFTESGHPAVDLSTAWRSEVQFFVFPSFGQFYSALQKLNTPQTTKTAQIILFIERVRLPLDCILLEGCGGTTFADTAQVVVGFPPTCARAVLIHCLTSSVLSSVALFSNNFGWLCRDVTVRKQKYANASLTCISVSAKTLGQSG